MLERFFLPVSVLACLALLGCSSDESVVCERLDECDLLKEISVSQCEDEAASQVPEDRLAKCAECVEEKGCKDIQDGCRAHCEPGD